MIAAGIAKWACLQAPNTTYEPVYSIDLYVDKDEAAKAKEKGAIVKVDDDGDEVTCCPSCQSIELSFDEGEDSD